jgi:hypothetical protein
MNGIYGDWMNKILFYILFGIGCIGCTPQNEMNNDTSVDPLIEFEAKFDSYHVNLFLDQDTEFWEELAGLMLPVDPDKIANLYPGMDEGELDQLAYTLYTNQGLHHLDHIEVELNKKHSISAKLGDSFELSDVNLMTGAVKSKLNPELPHHIEALWVIKSFFEDLNTCIEDSMDPSFSSWKQCVMECKENPSKSDKESPTDSNPNDICALERDKMLKEDKINYHRYLYYKRSNLVPINDKRNRVMGLPCDFYIQMNS